MMMISLNHPAMTGTRIGMKEIHLAAVEEVLQAEAAVQVEAMEEEHLQAVVVQETHPVLPVVEAVVHAEVSE